MLISMIVKPLSWCDLVYVKLFTCGRFERVDTEYSWDIGEISGHFNSYFKIFSMFYIIFTVIMEKMNISGPHASPVRQSF